MDEAKVQLKAREQEEAATKQRAAVLGLPYVDSRDYEQTLALVEGVLEIEEMHKNRTVPLVRGDESSPWQFGVTAQSPQSFIASLKKKYADQAQNVQFFLLSQSGFRNFMLRYDPPEVIIHDDIEIAKDGDSDTINKVTETLGSVGADEIFDYLIDQADKLGASDIHVENQREEIRIRMRVDGALHPVATLSKDRYRIILAALASRANVSTASNEPQSGHMQKEMIKEGESEPRILNMRIEVVPTMYGHDSVIRLFNYDASMLNLDRLGIQDRERKEIDDIVSHPRGMVLMVGPTGSGKSTTLYSMIQALNTTDRKIITLEDPIEFGVPGVSQIPVDTTSGHSFADNLRSVLRLDPDVVMVGEIRDADTAKTAIQASITGHLVLSTFHANSTSAAFSRMIDLIGVNPIFSTAIRLVIAQRLVRRLDDATKEPYEPDEATKDWIRKELSNLPEHVEVPDLNNIVLYKPVPSEENPFGYSGRAVVMEQMVVTESVQKFLKGDVADVDSVTIEKEARRGGMVTLLENGLLAVLRGETTLEEVNRVI